MIANWMNSGYTKPQAMELLVIMDGDYEEDVNSTANNATTTSTTTTNNNHNNGANNATTTRSSTSSTLPAINLHGQYAEEVEAPVGNGEDRSCWKAIESNQLMALVVCILFAVLIAIVIFVAVFLSTQKK
eukprot:gene25984-34584_t